MNLLRCAHPRDLVVTAILLTVLTSAWIGGYDGFVGWTPFVIVPMVLAAYRNR